MSELIPCPVCGRPLSFARWPYLEGSGTTGPTFVDCPLRHHSILDPQTWEELRLKARIKDLECALIDLRDQPSALTQPGRNLTPRQ